MNTKHTQAQFGMTVGADFEANTMTLEMDPGYVVAVGPVAVLPRSTYDELLEALQKWLGPTDDPSAGWRGSGGTHELYACEYCNAKHSDCTQIQHSATCPIPFARAAIAKALGR